jgi:hypothetical protein
MKKQTKKAYGMVFLITEILYVKPTNNTWEKISQEIKPDRLNLVSVSVNNGESVETVNVYGFHIIKDKKTKSFVFLSDLKRKLWAVRF